MNDTSLSTAAIEDLKRRTTGRVLLPNDGDYAMRATPWNVAHASTPCAVVEVANADDVAACVQFAAEQGIEVAVQATGHGALGFPRTTLLVHTALLDELVIRDDGSARIGAGVCWGAVLEAGAPFGLAGLAGSAPGVGVVGYVTGGGMGPVARTHGFASDHVTAFDVVTGDGVIRRATAVENPALFWGLRGGKGALGIVTAVEMQLMPIADLYGGCLYFAAQDVATVLRTWRDWSATLPEQATTSLAILRLPAMPMVPPPLAGQVTAAVRFAWVGEPEEGKAAFAPIRAAAPSVLGDVGLMPYAALGSIHADPVDPMPVHEAATLLRELPSEAIDVLLSHAGAEAHCPQVIVELRLMGGAIAREPRHPSAIGHRDAAYSLVAIGIAAPPVIAATTAHAEALLASVHPWSTGGRLPNFGASASPAEIARAYAPHTAARLATLAETYDPRHVLSAARPYAELDWITCSQ